MVNNSVLPEASFNTLLRAPKRIQIKVFLFAYNRIYTHIFKHKFTSKKPSGQNCMKLIFLRCFLFFSHPKCNKDNKILDDR